MLDTRLLQDCWFGRVADDAMNMLLITDGQEFVLPVLFDNDHPELLAAVFAGELQSFLSQPAYHHMTALGTMDERVAVTVRRVNKALQQSDTEHQWRKKPRDLQFPRQRLWNMIEVHVKQPHGIVNGIHGSHMIACRIICSREADGAQNK